MFDKRETGHIKFYDIVKGYGFIVPDNPGGGDLFFLNREIFTDVAIDRGVRVSFFRRQGTDGRFYAKNLKDAA
jgi:cold shock CspA family protein